MRQVRYICKAHKLCDELQYSIQQSIIENEKLLQGALRDALKKGGSSKCLNQHEKRSKTFI